MLNKFLFTDNIPVSRIVSEFDIVNRSKLLQLLNAHAPTVVTLFGKTTVFNNESLVVFAGLLLSVIYI